MCSLTASAHHFEVGGICYNITSSTDLTVEVTYEGRVSIYNNEYTGAVTIPETVTYNSTTYRVTSIGERAFYYCRSLTSITIPESVTSIGYDAFEDCRNLRLVVNFSNLDIEKGSSSHGYVAYYAERVITVDEAIDKYCFHTLEEGTHYLVYYYGNDSILNLPEDYHGDDYIIDTKAFADDARIVSVNIPQTVGEIGSSAFAGCANWHL